MNRIATVGKRAPGFSCSAINGNGEDRFSVSLDDYIDRWVVLLFYPRDFSMI